MKAHLAHRRLRRYVFLVRFRPLHIAILIFQAIWLNAVVPGHQRGVISVPGSEAQSSAVEDSCSACRSEPSRDPAEKNSPKKNAPSKCAVCFFAAYMGLPPVTVWPLTPLGLLHRVEAERFEKRVAAIVLLPFDCRGPPAMG